MFDFDNIPDSLLVVFLQRLVFSFGIYALFAGIAFGIFYLWRKNPVRRYRIQRRRPSDQHLQHELFWSAITRLLFAVIGVGVAYFISKGWQPFYYNIADHGWGYFVLTLFVLILGHDAYFYWVHRLMHTKALYKFVHAVHHHSTNPTPLASFSFHPSEAVIEAAYFPLIILVMPVHPAALLFSLIFQTAYNVLGHAGFEFLPKGWVRHPILKYMNTPTHHNLHHAKFRTNYSLYFNWWDRIGNTLWPQYEAEFDRVKAQTADPAIGQPPMTVRSKKKPDASANTGKGGGAVVVTRR